MEDLKKNVKLLEKDLQKLETKLDDNVALIINNMNKLHKHEEKINNNSLKIKENGYALEILKDYKFGNKRLFISLIIVLIMWFVTIGYLVYILNDVGSIETTQEIEDVETIENSNVINGDMYGENKTNN